jgi:fibronectin type 3 domain-containing protein
VDTTAIRCSSMKRREGDCARRWATSARAWVLLAVLVAMLVGAAPGIAATPAVPVELTAQVVQTSVYLRWQKNTEPEITGYQVYKQTSTGTWVAAGVASGTVYLVNNLTPGTTYTYRIATVNKTGQQSPPSAPVSFVPYETTPPVVVGLKAAAEDSRVHLSWTASSATDIAHYAIYRQSAGGSWPTTPTATTTSTTYTYTDTGLSDGTTYSYRLTAVNHTGSESTPSSVASATPRDTTPPKAPEGLTARSGEESQVTLSWAPSVDPRLDYYAIYRESPEGSWPATPIATTTSTSYLNAGLSDGISYTYRVLAVDQAGSESVESVPSSAASATPRDTTPPKPPEGLTAQSGEESQVTLSWTPSTDPRLDYYAIYRESPEGSWPTTPIAMLSPSLMGGGLSGEATYTNTGLSDGTAYTYRIAAVDQAGSESVESVPSSTASGTPRDMTPPKAPEGLTAQSGEESQVTLSWTPSVDPRFDYYAVYRENPEGSPEGPWPLIPTATTTSASYVETGLSDGTTYVYRITAVDHIGSEYIESPPSSTASAIPRFTDPVAPPEGLSASGEESQVALSWTASTDPRFDYYAVYRENPEGSPEGPWPLIPTATTTSASYVETGLSDGTTYSYRVVAVDHADSEYVESAPSLVVSSAPRFVTAPAAPEGLAALSGEEAQVYLSWTASTDPRFDYYAIYRENPEGSPEGAWPLIPTATTRSPDYLETGLTDGTAYSYRVTAVDQSGSEYLESAPSLVASATPRFTTAPAAPENLVATAGDEQNTLSWSTNTDPRFDYYAIYRENPEGSWSGTPLATTKSTEYTDAEVIGGTQYTYRVTAVDILGNETTESTPSPEASATPTETTPPATPSQPVITQGEGQLGVSWPLDKEYGVDKYQLYRQEASGTWSSTPLATTSHNWWTDLGLTNGTTHSYRVVAVDHAGLESPPSSVAEGTPGPVSIVNPGTLFSPESPWNQPLEESAPVDPDSELMMRGINPETGQSAEGAQGGLLASIAKTGTTLEAYSGYSSPVYVVPADQPLVPVNVVEPNVVNHVALEKVLSKGVPIPPNAQSATGTDGHMTIYQPSTNTLWDLWRACSPEGPNNYESWIALQSCPKTPALTWTVQYGGVMTNVSQSLGYFDANSDPGYSGYFWGATATSLPVAAGMVTMAELQAGEIKHALALDIPGYGLPGAVCAYNDWKLPNDAGITPMVWPAQRSDGTYFGPDCIPEGARLRIEPSFNLNSIQLPKVARMFAVAAQKYGMIVRDKDAGGVSFFAEDPVSLKQEGVKLDPYTELPWTNAGASPGKNGLLAGNPTWSLFKNFPWSHVQVMRMTVCHAVLAPCPPGGD